MSQFATAFEKEASVAGGLGKAVSYIGKGIKKGVGAVAGAAGKATQAVVVEPAKAVARSLGGTGAEFGIGRRSVRTGKTPGDALAAARVRRIQKARGGAGAVPFSELEAAASKPAKDRGTVPSRFHRARSEGKLQKGPSFAHRHPFLTAGGAVLASRYALGGKKEESPGPQISYPQQQQY